MARHRGPVMLLACAASLAGCASQPRLNVAWYLYPEGSGATEKNEIIMLYIGNAGKRPLWVSTVRIGDVEQPIKPFGLDRAGSYRIVRYSAGEQPPSVCWLPTSMQVQWSPREDKRAKWSKPISFNGKSPGYLPDAWVRSCSAPLR